MKFKSALVTEASGSVGGMTASHNRFGLYLRARAIPVNGMTVLQQAVRNAIAQITTAWSATLTQAQRDAWEAYANAVPISDRLGSQRFLTGLNWYCACNVPRLQAGLTRVDNGPTDLLMAEGTAPVATVTAPSTLSVAFTNSDAWAGEVGGALLVYASAGTNPTRNFFAGPYRYAGKVAGAVVPPTSPAALTLPQAVAAGQRVHFQARIVRADGRISSPFRLFDDAA